MNIAFVTTQSIIQSTVIGRVLPLAEHFQKMGHSVTIFLHTDTPTPTWIPGQARNDNIKLYFTGPNPFKTTKYKKRRQSGMQLLLTMSINALRAAWGLIKVRPQYFIIVKPLPENVLAVSIAKLFLWKTKVILDVDDFELFANNLSSLIERSAIHASERIATSLADNIVVATPFLYDHIHQMTAGTKNVVLIPTGLTLEDVRFEADNNHTMLYIGSIALSSGHRVDMLPEILVHVRKQIPDARLLIAGSGHDESELKKLFQDLGVDTAVDFYGRFIQADIVSLIAKATVLIDPIDASIAVRAKSSFRCALALATGMPIVTSSIGIRTDLLPETLHEKFFAIPENPSSYANSIIALMQTPLSEEEKTSMNEQALTYSWEQLASTYGTLLI